MYKKYKKLLKYGLVLIIAMIIILQMPINPFHQLIYIESPVPTVAEIIFYNLPESNILKALRNRNYKEVSRILNDNPKLSSKRIQDRKKNLIEYADYYYSKGLVTDTYPLHITSSIYPSEQIVELLINKGADINAVDHSGKTALQLAIVFEQYDICKKLIAAGADVNIKDTSGWAAIHYAVMVGDMKYVDLVLNSGGNINDKIEGNGKTPLINSLYLTDKYIDGKEVSTLDYIHALIKKGANLKQIEDKMFMESLRFNKEFSLEMLDNGYRMKRQYYKEIAQSAIASGCIRVVEILLKDGFDVNQSVEPDYYAVKYTPLVWAIHNHENNLAMIELLIANGADIYFKIESESESAVEYAESTKNIDKKVLVDLYNKYRKK